VDACLARTGCDGVMVSEALLENPGLFSCGVPLSGPLAEGLGGEGGGGESGGGGGGGGAPATLERSRALVDQFALTRRYLALFEECGPAKAAGIAKGHVFKQLYGVWRVFPDLMERLSTGAPTLDAMRGVVEDAAARYDAAFRPVLFTGARGGGAGGGGVAPYAAALRATLEGDGGAAWAEAAAGAPECAWAPPYYLADPAQPGAWYMRHRGADAYHVAAPPHAKGAPCGDQ